MRPTNKKYTSNDFMLPPDGVLVHTMISDEHGERCHQKMTRKGNLYFSDGMYVYYKPTHWTLIDANEVKCENKYKFV